MKKFLWVIVLILPSVLIGQTLTQKEMLADFDQLESIINNYYRAKDLVEQRTQTNVTEELKLLRQECYSISSDSEFADLIRKSLNTLCDKHTSIANSSLVKMYVARFPDISNYGNVKLADTLNADYYYNLAYNNVMSKMKCGIRAKYINGEYYNLRSFINKDIFVASGEQITAINGIPVSKYVAQNKYTLYNLTWDEKNQNWYSELFWLNNKIIKDSVFCLTIGKKEIMLNCSVTVNRTEKLQEFSSTPLVTILDSNILFIRLPYMQNSKWYIEQVTNQYNSNIKKIIIDIRGNSGGQDKVWQDILSVLISKPMLVKTNISMNNNDAIRRILPFYNISEPRIISSDTIFPAPNNINFKGKIYVLQDNDTYSSASSLSSLAFQMDELLLIGQPTSYIGGSGLTPLIWRLDNSGIILRMPFTADLSGGFINPYMNKVEIEIPQNVETFFETITENQYDIEYLINKDKLIEFVRKQY
ncbi:MAG: S41 family peptidase [bacterium]